MEILERIESLNPNQQLRVLQLVKQNIYKDNLALIATKLCGYKDLQPNTHRSIIHALQSPKKRKLIVMPRGSFKSSLCSVAWPIQLILKNPDIRILLDSELYSNSKNLLREIKQHLTSELFTNLYGQFENKACWNEGEFIIKQRTKILKEATVTASGIGAEKTGQHYDCLAPGTMILSSNGYLPVESVRAAHRVLTSDGKFRSVVAVCKKRSKKRLVGLRAAYQPFTNWVTEDHRVYVFRDEAAQWVPASDVRLGDYLATPRITAHTRAVSRTNRRINDLLCRPNVWRFIGYWLAEGSRTTANPNAIRLIFGAHEKALIADVVRIVRVEFKKHAVVLPNSKGAVSVKFSDADVKELLSKFGSYSYDKHIPPFALNADRVLQRQLLNGYWRGDGYSTGPVVGFSSVSASLLTGIQLILARMGIQSGITQCRNAGKSLVVGVECNVKDAYNLTSSNQTLSIILGRKPSQKVPTKPTRSFFTNNFWWVPVSEIHSKRGGGFVYDIQVQHTHNFYSPGMILHNCIIADDLNSPTNSATPEGRQKVIDHYRYCVSLLEPHGTLAIIGTRYAENDAIGYALSNEIESWGNGTGILREPSITAIR